MRYSCERVPSSSVYAFMRVFRGGGVALSCVQIGPSNRTPAPRRGSVPRLHGGQNCIKGGASRVLAPDQGEGERDDRLDRNEYRLLESRAEGCAYVEHDAETLANCLRAEIGVGVGQSVGLEARGPAGVEDRGGVARAVLAARYQQRLTG